MRIVLADDHRVVREGIRYMLADRPDLEVVGEVGNGQDLLAQLEAEPVDVVLLDVRMPGMTGLEALAQIRERFPEVRVVVLSMHDQPGYVRRAIELGAAGYLLKSSGRDEILRALAAISQGHSYIQGELMEPLIDSVGRQSPTPRRLRPRERQVLQLVADGYENKQIARALDLSEATVKTYLRAIFDRLGVSSRAEAVAVGLRLGIIE